MIHSCHEFFVEEKNLRQKILAGKPAERTARALGISRHSVFNAIQQVEAGDATAAVLGPVGKHRSGRKRVVFDEFLQGEVRWLIHAFFRKKEFPTLDKIYGECTTKLDDFPDVSRSTLWRNLKSMGFQHCKRSGNKTIHERQNVVARRLSYLREIKEFRRQGLPAIVFLDETWLNQHHQQQRAWRDDVEEVEFPKAPSGKGKRLILLHAAGSTGWVPNAELLFVGQNNSCDYHDEMNALHFEEWWSEKFLPNLPAGCVTVMDNAPYHTRVTEDSRSPTTATRKADVQEWLTARAIAWKAEMLKAELYTIIKAYKPPKKYVVDELATAQGFTVCHLPVAHCEVNPIELIWAQVKGEVGKINTGPFTMAAVRSHVTTGLAHVSEENWRKACDHVVKVEDQYVATEGILEEVKPLVIAVGGEDSDSEDSSSESEESDVE